ncbi:DUF6303 family protein [Streptomyces gamaensis]|uniref:DUF6303 family protein n=1 Tax=Streptomyces gamaensis TaxID=1763542 RepID=A0ABW0Z8U9_9ACTN
MRTVTAHLSSSGGPWRLYVVLMGVSHWPDFQWERPGPVPTIAERREALALLGYEPVRGAEWSWIEDTATYDPSSPVVLIAAIKVRKLTWGAG